MTSIQSSGIDPGQRRLNGPRTTGRNFRNLSQPAHVMTHDDDVAVPMRDGVALLADVHRRNRADTPCKLLLLRIRDRFKTLAHPQVLSRRVQATSSFLAALTAPTSDQELAKMRLTQQKAEGLLRTLASD